MGPPKRPPRFGRPPSESTERLAQARLFLRTELQCNPFQIVDIAPDDKCASAHIVADIVQCPIVHPAVDGRASNAKLLGGIADAHQLAWLECPVLRKRHHAAELCVPERAGYRVVIRGSRPKEQLHDRIDRLKNM